jgi:1-acyl-sn-glycerol-3-phosphate acyltransferase
MPKSTVSPAKPRASALRPELTRLPALTPERLAFRKKVAGYCKTLVRLLTRTTLSGLEHFPSSGPGLVVLNHLGDADVVLGLGALDIQPDAIAKVELIDYPILGRLLEKYGVIWVHRGTADRRALRAALDALDAGRFVAIAPEGRHSLTGSLEEATSGAAFLALRSGAPVIPVAVTGTRKRDFYGSLLRLRRPVVSLTFGPPFRLEIGPDRADSLRDGTDRIMRRIAVLLPSEYRGVYAE